MQSQYYVRYNRLPRLKHTEEAYEILSMTIKELKVFISALHVRGPLGVRGHLLGSLGYNLVVIVSSQRPYLKLESIHLENLLDLTKNLSVSNICKPTKLL